MVTRVAKDGGEYEDGPYTEAEDEEFYWRISHGVVAVMHGSRSIVPQPPRPPKDDPSSDPPESPTQVPAK